MANADDVDIEVVDEALIRQQTGEVIRELGISETRRQFRMTRETLLRIAGGAPVRRGSFLVAREALQARAARATSSGAAKTGRE